MSYPVRSQGPDLFARPMPKFPASTRQRSRGLTFVSADLNNSNITSSEIAAAAGVRLEPTATVYATAVLILHARYDYGSVSLSGIRDNPVLQSRKTKDGTPFPKQVDVAIRVNATSSNLPFKTAVIDSIKAKMFYADLSSDAQKLIDEIFDTASWMGGVCVKQTKKAVVLTTGVTNLSTYKERQYLKVVLDDVMSKKKEQGIPEKDLTDFRVVHQGSIDEFSKETYGDDELTKAEKAYDKYKGSPMVAFNGRTLQMLNEHHLGLIILPAGVWVSDSD